MILLFLAILLCLSTKAQQAIVDIESDDTLPIAHTRFDNAVEPPKDNFSSISKNDMWEKFERGELDQKAFLKLQQKYLTQYKNSKDPYVKRKIKQRQIASKRKARLRAKYKAIKNKKNSRSIASKNKIKKAKKFHKRNYKKKSKKKK